MPSLRLPPLPPPATWGSHFVRTNIASSPDPITHRSFPNRVLLANRDISDQFVRALGIRPNEVVLETFAGNGCLTRSLLHGGNPENTAEISAAWSAQKESGVTEPPNDGAMDFPTWKAELASHESTPSTLSDTPLPTPRLVIACEPSPDFLVRGLGMPKSQIPPRIGIPQTIHGKAQASESSDKDRRHTTAHIESSQYVATVHQSTFEPNLLLSPTTPYVWETVPSILSNELVASKLERYSPTNNNSRPWSAPAPPITLVAQMADSSVSDQMLAQWIASAIGADSKPSWIWAWGRVRLAMLLPSQSYDRLVAKPEEPARSKLSVIANALFHISPLPPLHHVVNVDKRSSRTESRFTKVGRGIYREDKDLNQQRIGEQEREPRTITYPRDFWPIRTGLVNAGRAYPRPPFLGILLEPRVSSVIRQEQKDSWEYVLRRCFVREAVPFRDAVKTLGFGGENLIPKFELFDDQFLGERVNVDKLVRDLRAEEWARVVDVFDRWAFRPQILTVDLPLDEDLGRHFGHSL